MIAVKVILLDVVGKSLDKRRAYFSHKQSILTNLVDMKKEVCIKGFI